MTDYPETEYSDEEEYADNFLEEQREAWDEAGGAYPIAKKPESLFSLFKDVWKTQDSTKIANIDPKTELGDLGISVRHAKKISHVANLLSESDVHDYFGSLSEITLSTSMAKKGWFTELFVSTKKFAQKGNIQNLQGTDKNKWRLFGKSQQPSTEA